ncbi:MAG: DegT/DnrJ/EryC1/StrS family aminotransferase [Pseudolysinimonas sp.]
MASSGTTEPSPDPIPFNDLSRFAPDVRARIDAAVDRVVSSGWFVMGPEHDAFEAELAAYLGVAHAVLVANGTDALELAFAALGVQPGDSIVTVANAGGYSSVAARLLGAEPVYVDIDAGTHQATALGVREAIEGAPTPPRAVVVTHLYGGMAPVAEIVAVAREHGIPVIEDTAQALGATFEGRRAGSFGDIATTSFYPTKNLGALGDGGAVVTSDPVLAATVRRMRQYGWEGKYNIAHARGRNSRLDELQAAILRERLPELDAWNERRREIHRRYEAAVSSGARLVNTAGESFIGHLAVLETDDRDAVRDRLLALGIRTDIHYPTPDHLQPLIAREHAQPGLPVTERAAGRILSLPLFPELRDDEIDRICAALGQL